MTLGGVLGVVAVCGGVMLAFMNLNLRGVPGITDGGVLETFTVPDVFASGNPFAGEATRVVDAFLAEVGQPDASFHVDTTGGIVARSGFSGLRLDVGTFEDHVDVAGDDFRGRTEATGPDEASNFSGEIVYIDGNVWWLFDGSSHWITGSFDQPVPVNPFVRLQGPHDIRYVGMEERNGAPVHHLRTRRWLGAYLDSIMDNPEIDVGQYSNIVDIYVNDHGIPISMHLVATIEVEAGFEQATIEVTADYLFSSWGAPIEISPPI